MAVLHRNHRKGMAHQNVQLDVMFLVLAVRNNIECEMKKKKTNIKLMMMIIITDNMYSTKKRN